MPSDCISYAETNYYSDLILDYLAQKEEVKPFYNRFPSLREFRSQIQEKQQHFSPEIRKTLVSSLQKQYSQLQLSEETRTHIQLLLKENTFTVTTGHQLNLFTGPLYFLYKIISTFNLTRELASAYPEYNFVPVYWMATEDHDFEEINYFILHGKKFQWNPAANPKTGGAVGELPTAGLEEVLALFAAELGGGRQADKLRSLFEAAYLGHDNLADATRFLANELFGKEGLVILDANEPDLKEHFIPY